jgi:hypothetical protein
MARPLDVAAARAALIRNDDEMDPKKSGLYRRYELLVTQLLDREHLSVEQLLAQRLDPLAVERRVREP